MFYNIVSLLSVIFGQQQNELQYTVKQYLQYWRSIKNRFSSAKYDNELYKDSKIGKKRLLQLCSIAL